MITVKTTCQNCGESLKVPSNLGDLVITCSICDYKWTEFSSNLGSASVLPACTNIPWAWFSRPTPTRTPTPESLKSKPLEKPRLAKSHSSTLGSSTETKDEICPVCLGDGGVNGGCYKCEGSGWVTATNKDLYKQNAQSGKSEEEKKRNSKHVQANIQAIIRRRILLRIDGKI